MPRSGELMKGRSGCLTTFLQKRVRYWEMVLPAAADLRDMALRDEAAAALASLCRIGGQLVEGVVAPMAGDRLRVFARIFMHRRQAQPSSDARRIATLSSGYRSPGTQLPARPPLELHGGLLPSAILALLHGSLGSACAWLARATRTRRTDKRIGCVLRASRR